MTKISGVDTFNDLFDTLGGPAFPFLFQEDKAHQIFPGMTLRDWFAGQALPVAMTEVVARGSHWAPDAANVAYRMADAMLAARNARATGKAVPDAL